MAELQIESGDRHVDGGLGRRRRVAGVQGAAQRVECSVHASSACAKWSTATSTMRPPLNAMNWLATVSTRCPAHVNVLVTGSRVISARAGLPPSSPSWITWASCEIGISGLVILVGAENSAVAGRRARDRGDHHCSSSWAHRAAGVLNERGRDTVWCARYRRRRQRCAIAPVAPSHAATPAANGHHGRTRRRRARRACSCRHPASERGGPSRPRWGCPARTERPRVAFVVVGEAHVDPLVATADDGYGIPCGMASPDGPKSGCRRRSAPPMEANHAPLRACTGWAETSACQTSSAGNSGQPVAPEGGLPPVGPAPGRATMAAASSPTSTTRGRTGSFSAGTASSPTPGHPGVVPRRTWPGALPTGLSSAPGSPGAGSFPGPRLKRVGSRVDPHAWRTSGGVAPRA